MGPLIVALIKEVVNFHPAAIFRKDRIEIVSPYSLLYHYFGKIQARVSHESSSPELLEHLGYIERFVEQNWSERYQEIRDSLTTNDSVAFEDL